MRYGILSDIHGNLPALEEAVSLLREEGAQSFLCAGDIVGYGANPNECIDLLRDIGADCVTGNHEAILLGRLPDAVAGRLALRSLKWTDQVLTARNRLFLEGLPGRAELPGGVLLVHASLQDPQLYVRRPEQADQQLGLLESSSPSTRWLLLGHFHRAWAYSRRDGMLKITPDGSVGLSERGSCMLNPGSVGQSHERELRPRARFMMLDTDREMATFHAAPYDVERTRNELRRAGLPPGAYHRRPPILPLAFHRARSAFGRRLGREIRRLAA